MGSCDFCGARGPVTQVHYRQNTGMLVMRQSKEWAGNACRECGMSWFWKTMLHNLFLGWWGMISLIVTPIFILMNLGSMVKVLGLPKAQVAARAQLEEHSDYARNLLATKDRATVIEQLVRVSGASETEVYAFVEALEKKPAA
jgi:hypothetical protein